MLMPNCSNDIKFVLTLLTTFVLLCLSVLLTLMLVFMLMLMLMLMGAQRLSRAKPNITKSCRGSLNPTFLFQTSPRGLEVHQSSRELAQRTRDEETHAMT